jgi:uncharacterized membrane-anchored protein YitT (DUF2179 family)
MKFKPNLLKSLISLIAGTIILIYVAGSIKCKVPQDCGIIGAYQILLSLIAILIVYIVWSLLQQGDNKSKIQSVNISKQENDKRKIEPKNNKSKKLEKKQKTKKRKK